MKLVSQQEAAAELGISPSALRRWPTRPVRREGARALYDIDALKEYRDQRNQRGASLAVERARLTAAQAALAELDLAERRLELVPVETVITTWVSLVGAARSRLLAMPAALAPLVAELPVDQAEAVIRSAVHEALAELSDDCLARVRKSKGKAPRGPAREGGDAADAMPGGNDGSVRTCSGRRGREPAGADTGRRGASSSGGKP